MAIESLRSEKIIFEYGDEGGIWGEGVKTRGVYRVGNSIYELKKTVYDQDGLPGIYVPLNIKAEASKEAADEVVGDLNTGIYGTDMLSTGVNAVSNAAKSVFRKKNNQIVVTVKSNYKLYLK